ncbi:MAG: hypothetical protein ACFBSE_10685 [Prochloraceae cyanobacterium]
MLKSSRILVNLAILLLVAILFSQEIVQNWIWYEEVKKADNIIVNLGLSFQMSDRGSIVVKSLFISWILVFALFEIFQYIFSRSQKRLDSLLSGMLPAFNPVIITDRGIFYPFEFIAWQEIRSCDRPVWLEDTFYLEGKKFRVTADNQDRVETILQAKLDSCFDLP